MSVSAVEKTTDRASACYDRPFRCLLDHDQAARIFEHCVKRKIPEPNTK